MGVASADDNGLKDRAAEFLRDVSRRLSGLVGAAQSRAQPVIQEGRAVLVDQARRLQSRARTLHFPEEPNRIIQSASFFEPLGERDAEVAPELQSLPWRGDAILVLSAAGVVALEDHILGFTRRIFHDELQHQDLSQRLFGVDFDAVHGYMDTVPGRTVRGGGITHRLHHGHDFEAAQAIYAEHGLPGALAWVQHVAQDTMTPTGAPIPVGGQRLAEWLVDEGIATKGNAALLLSFNIAEIAAGFLGGVFMLRLAALLPELQRRRTIRKRLERAAAAWETDDLDAVIANYGEARSLARNQEPAIDLALGWAYAAADRPMAESFLAFRSAAMGLATEDRALDLDGLVVSLRGTAYLLALSQSVQVLDMSHLEGTWRSELNRMAQGGIASFESLAIAQDERYAVEVGDRRVQFRPRPLSAAANYYLAARVAAGAPFLPVSGDMQRLGERAVQMLDRAAEVHAGVTVLSEVHERWSRELAPLGLPTGSQSEP